MRVATTILSAGALLALAAGGCSNSSNEMRQPMSTMPNTSGSPAYESFNPPEYPNAGGTMPVTPKGGAGGTGYYGTPGAPLVAPTQTGPNGQSTLEKQQGSGYFPSADAPLVPANPQTR